MPSDQGTLIEQAEFTYSPLGKAFEKLKKKKNDDQVIKQVQALKALKSKEDKKDIKSIQGFFQKI